MSVLLQRIFLVVAGILAMAVAAAMQVRNMTGHLVGQFTVSGEEGQVNWAVQKLAAGVYSVDLVRDGRTVETQRLILQP